MAHTDSSEDRAKYDEGNGRPDKNRLPAALWRWLPAPSAAIIAFFGMLYFNIFLLIFSPVPKDFTEPAAGFLMGSVVVLAGSLAAPSRRTTVAVVLFAIIVPVALLLRLPLVGTIAGGAVSVAFAAWWFHSRHTKLAVTLVAAGTLGAFIIYGCFAYARYIDKPEHPVPPADELLVALGANASRIHAFYRYDLGGFIDQQWLWRIDASQEAIDLVIAGLELERTESVPERFWKMPPYYWPRSLPEGAETYQSRFFSADNRGRDGNHYFLLHDKAQGRTFVWVKNNF